MSVSINNVVTVSLLQGGELALADNPNVTMIITSEQQGPINSNDRYRVYSSASSVAADFGTTSKINEFATAFFGTRPNPINAGGFLVVGYWRGENETVPAAAATLTGAQLSEVTTVDTLQQVSDGSFSLDIDGVTEDLTSLDFQASTTLAEVAGVIDAALAGATATVDDQRIVITSDTTGVSSTITFATDSGSGTFVGDTLALTNGAGAVTTQGSDSGSLSPEDKLEAITALANEVKFRGAMFIDGPTDQEAKDIAEWAQANDTLVYDVFSSPDNLDVDVTNVVWDIKLSGLSNYRMLYSKANNRKLAATYMARVHTVNFAAEDSALTIHLKELAVAAEDYTQSEISKAQQVGLDLYTTIKLTPVVLTSGANVFTDERYNLIAFKDFLEVDMFNLLKLTATKIPQTRQGVAQLVDQAEKTTRQFVRSGVAAPGEWTSPDSFGNREVFERNIRDNGFYWIAGSLADQSQASREARESPVLQGAVKLAGAVHSVDLIVNINR